MIEWILFSVYFLDGLIDWLVDWESHENVDFHETSHCYCFQVRFLFDAGLSRISVQKATRFLPRWSRKVPWKYATPRMNLPRHEKLFPVRCCAASLSIFFFTNFFPKCFLLYSEKRPVAHASARRLESERDVSCRDRQPWRPHALRLSPRRIHHSQCLRTGTGLFYSQLLLGSGLFLFFNNNLCDGMWQLRWFFLLVFLGVVAESNASSTEAYRHRNCLDRPVWWVRRIPTCFSRSLAPVKTVLCCHVYSEEGILLCFADATTKFYAVKWVSSHGPQLLFSRIISCSFCLGYSSDGSLEHRWSVNCKQRLPRLMKSISSLAYARNQNLIVIASTINVKVNEDLNSPWSAGLSVWMTSEKFPHLELVSDEEFTDVRSIDWLIDWLTHRLIDWLIDWLTHWLIDWRIVRLIDWLFNKTTVEKFSFFSFFLSVMQSVRCFLSIFP